MVLFLWERLIDLYFTVDIFLNFRSAYENEEGQVVFNQSEVRVDAENAPFHTTRSEPLIDLNHCSLRYNALCSSRCSNFGESNRQHASR